MQAWKAFREPLIHPSFRRRPESIALHSLAPGMRRDDAKRINPKLLSVIATLLFCLGTAAASGADVVDQSVTLTEKNNRAEQGTQQRIETLDDATRQMLEEYHALGREFPDPEELRQYALVIHCGGCMIRPQKLSARVRRLVEAGIPVTNYGLALSWYEGRATLGRVLAPWLGGLGLAALFAAELSSADAILFMLSTSLSRDLYQAVLTHPLIVEDGYGAPPEGPGWGADLDDAVLAQHPPAEFIPVESEPYRAF